MNTLIIGSLGHEKKEGTVRVDIVPEWCDVCCDIRKGIPIDEKFDYIECKHIMEHIQLTEDFISVMWDFHRLLKDDGKLYIEVPHKDTNMAYECIGHVRYFVENSFINFYSNPYAKEQKYPVFKLIEKHIGQCNGEKTVCITLTK